MNEQIEEFISLWNQLLKLEQKIDLNRLYPNFSKLTVNEVSVIDFISKYPNSILKDIVSALDLPKSTLTNVINSLDKKGYLHRVITKQDYRSFGLELTEKGLQAQKEHLSYEKETFGSVIDVLNPEECTQLLNIMRKILKSAES